MATNAANEGQAAPGFVGPQGAFIRLTELGDETFILIDWGLDGTGKTLWALRHMPLPIMVLNLDRPINAAHLGMLPRERAEQIFVMNLRESVDSINRYEAVAIKDQMETAIESNLAWLKGGTVLIDGGTMLRDVLKLADDTIGPKVAAKTRFNPKDKAQVNAYLAAFMSRVNDQGINLVITAHAANSWVMKSTRGDDGEMHNTLTRTNNLYAKFDDIGFERSNLNLLLFKRCECGRNIINQDGTCVNQSDPFEDKPNVQHHYGRRHMIRIVTNKFNSSSEGTEWEDLDMKTLRVLCFDAEKAKKLIAASQA